VKNLSVWLSGCFVFLVFASADIGRAAAEDKPDQKVSPVRGFDGLVRRSVHLWSDGTRLAGDLTYPSDFSADKEYPCIVMCHGWGGMKQHLNAQIGPQFAEAGYVVFTFDYRGWGESNSRLVVDGDLPKPDADGNVSVKARVFRQIVDPRDQQEDIDAAISFVEGEPMVDAQRIGIWGSSFGGGHVIWRAARDSRAKCVVAQVGGMDANASVATAEGIEMVRQDKIKRARGELAPFPSASEAEKPAGLVGTPFYSKFSKFTPADDAKNVKVPTLIIDAELEHYFDNKNNGHKAYMNIKGNAPVEYHELKGKKHYDVYTNPTLKAVMALEIPWFDKYLK
jgi:dienelactone hydrolase